MVCMSSILWSTTIHTGNKQLLYIKKIDTCTVGVYVYVEPGIELTFK